MEIQAFEGHIQMSSCTLQGWGSRDKAREA